MPTPFPNAPAPHSSYQTLKFSVSRGACRVHEQVGGPGGDIGLNPTSHLENVGGGGVRVGIGDGLQDLVARAVHVPRRFVRGVFQSETVWVCSGRVGSEGGVEGGTERGGVRSSLVYSFGSREGELATSFGSLITVQLSDRIWCRPVCLNAAIDGSKEACIVVAIQGIPRPMVWVCFDRSDKRATKQPSTRSGGEGWSYLLFLQVAHRMTKAWCMYLARVVVAAHGTIRVVVSQWLRDTGDGLVGVHGASHRTTDPAHCINRQKRAFYCVEGGRAVEGGGWKGKEITTRAGA